MTTQNTTSPKTPETSSRKRSSLQLPSVETITTTLSKTKIRRRNHVPLYSEQQLHQFKELKENIKKLCIQFYAGRTEYTQLKGSTPLRYSTDIMIEGLAENATDSRLPTSVTDRSISLIIADLIEIKKNLTASCAFIKCRIDGLSPTATSDDVFSGGWIDFLSLYFGRLD